MDPPVKSDCDGAPGRRWRQRRSPSRRRRQSAPAALRSGHWKPPAQSCLGDLPTSCSDRETMWRFSETRLLMAPFSCLPPSLTSLIHLPFILSLHRMIGRCARPAQKSSGKHTLQSTVCSDNKVTLMNEWTDEMRWVCSVSQRHNRKTVHQPANAGKRCRAPAANQWDLNAKRKISNRQVQKMNESIIFYLKYQYCYCYLQMALNIIEIGNISCVLHFNLMSAK